MTRPNRREALKTLGLGTAGLLLPTTWTQGSSAIRLDNLDDLSRRFRETPHGEVFDVASEAIRAGADYQMILGAVFLAGIHDIRPRQVGGKLHAVMMVESAFQLAEGSSAEGAWLAAFWNLDDLKRSQLWDRSQGDWVLPPRPEVSFSSEAEARREFVAAMDAWDDDRADRAIVGLLPYHTRESLFEILWPISARCYVNIGHKIIYSAQIERVLRRIGWETAEAPLRSLVHGLLFVRADGPRTSAFDHAAELSPKIPEDWLGGKQDPDESATLLDSMRDASSEEAQQLVVDALAEGLAPESIWDGLRLYASELFLQRPESPPQGRGAILPVHAVTVTNAFGHVWRATNDDRTKRLMMLQAAGWLPLLRRDLIRIVRLSTEGAKIDQLGVTADGQISTIDEAFEERSAAEARALLDRKPAAVADYLSQLRGHLSRKAVEHHQYKYAAAIEEESRLVDSRWTSRVLAPAIDYLPTAAEADTEILERSLHAMRNAGVA